MKNKISFTTLGCSKNDVDTSQMQSLLNKDEFEVVRDVEDADIAIVNTCGFIDSAKEESIDTILQISTLKENGNLKKLIVAGCLAQRYSSELMEEIPEIDAILGTGSIASINSLIEDVIDGDREILIESINSEYLENLKKQDVQVTEYVKISEGCNNNCTYCVIPSLRGRNRSRKIEDIVDEVKYLVENGTREVILIAQNTTDYGIDNYGEYKLVDLISEISKIEDLKWIRVLYMYPDNFSDELIDEFSKNEKLVKYVDIPLQHVSESVLRAMNRKTSLEQIKALIEKLRDRVDGIVIRTTFIVGFPGETEKDFNELLNFVKEQKLDRVGVFTYSREESTPAYNMKNQIDEDIKLQRQRDIMDVQEIVSENNLLNRVGSKMEVLIEEIADEKTYIGRSYMDSPDIDGVVYIKSESPLSIGEFVYVNIVDSLEHDLVGEV